VLGCNSETPLTYPCVCTAAQELSLKKTTEKRKKAKAVSISFGLGLKLFLGREEKQCHNPYTHTPLQRNIQT
jgi:hypothetical protein